MDSLERHLSEITDRLDAIQTDLASLIDHVRKGR
jgi:hypothetical protein